MLKTLYQFYINYEECKYLVKNLCKSLKASFILTMRNVNFGYSIEELFLEDCFILTMRNVNHTFKSKIQVSN